MIPFTEIGSFKQSLYSKIKVDRKGGDINGEIGVSRYKYQKAIMSGFDRRFSNYFKVYGGIKMGHKKSLKAKLALVGVILLVVLASFSFWTHRDDVFRGFDAGFEQSK